jgi:hypothetical protein
VPPKHEPREGREKSARLLIRLIFRRGFLANFFLSTPAAHDESRPPIHEACEQNAILANMPTGSGTRLRVA